MAPRYVRSGLRGGALTGWAIRAPQEQQASQM
jgi:hypothetical protein